MSTVNKDISLGEQLRASFETALSDLDKKCAEIIELNCRYRASRGYGFCQIKWDIDFYGMSIDKDRICQVATQMGVDVQDCDDTGIVLRWMDEQNIEKIKKRPVKLKPKKSKLETIPEEKSDTSETSETSEMDTTQTTSTS